MSRPVVVVHCAIGLNKVVSLGVISHLRDILHVDSSFISVTSYCVFINIYSQGYR